MDGDVVTIKDEAKIVAEVSQNDIHKCPKCNRTFLNVGHLKCHFYRVHPEFRLAACTVTVPYDCDKCKRSFATKDKLEAHACNFVIKGPPYHCEKCDKIFTKKCSLLRHYVTNAHIDEKNHICEVCFKGFSSKSVLEAHSRIHQPKEICNGCKTNSDKEEDHVNDCQRNEEKSTFKCKICSRHFDNHSSFKSHLLTHRQRKHFQCDDDDDEEEDNMDTYDDEEDEFKLDSENE
ncbi:hypothetical protein CEXT_534901 [Caerostris extrusa]|uniref:C2H2-type domain-containing protein n=1 Tax=Caerostris extrusa TaxID=172846 RepID=A0AAV4XRQ8_CAEEX|nr:hypothetical protein CEXT_534901 [Caerostris extrusa]